MYIVNSNCIRYFWYIRSGPKIQTLSLKHINVNSDRGPKRAHSAIPKIPIVAGREFKDDKTLGMNAKNLLGRQATVILDDSSILEEKKTKSRADNCNVKISIRTAERETGDQVNWQLGRAGKRVPI